MYLFPQEVGIGRFQPYGRYTFVNSVHASALDEFEAGVNYVIAGHNARISTWWRHGNVGGPAQTGFFWSCSDLCWSSAVKILSMWPCSCSIKTVMGFREIL